MSQKLQVKLNGIPVVGRIAGLETFTITYSRDSVTGVTQRAFSNELQFYDDGFDRIFQDLVADIQGLHKFIKVEIWDECCGGAIYKDLFIYGNSVDYCDGDCFVTARMVRDDPDEAIYQCLKNNPICTDIEQADGSFNPNHWLVNNQHPEFLYCDEMRPFAWGYLMIIVSAMLIIVISPLLLVIGFLQVIFGSRDDDTKINTLLGKLIDSLISCNRRHPSPRIVDYIGEASKFCGCDPNTPFISSFLTDPNSEYVDTSYFYAPIKKGIRISNTQTKYIVENRPRESAFDWISSRAKDFNAVWWVRNGQLYMERKDFYLNQPPIYDVVLNRPLGNILDGVCHTYNEEQLPSGQTISAQNDSHDVCGNNSISRYSKQVTYTPPNPNYGEPLNKPLSYAPTRFRSEFNPPSILDNAASTIPFLNFTFASRIAATSDYILMSQDECLVPKYIVWDRGSAIGMAKAKWRTQQWEEFIDGFNSYIKYTGKVQNFIYNLSNVDLQRNLYTDFHAIDDPNANPFRMFTFEVRVKMDCATALQLDVNRTIRIQTPYGAVINAKINQIVADYGSREITFTGQY